MINDEFMSIAVIGMSCRLPKANNINEFWSNILYARECYTTSSDEELRESGVPKEIYSNENFVRTKGILENIEYFDADFFDFTPKEASITDPQHRILLETAWEALEDAGYDANRFNGRIGIFAGQSMGDYLFMNLYPQIERYLSPKTLQMAIGNDKDSLTSKISYKLNLMGPGVTIQSSSSSSLVSIAMACQNLLCYESDMALAGGVCIGVPQKYGYMYEKGGIISKDGHCRTFDNNSDGFVISSGAGIVVIKRLADAIADRDHIYCVINSTSVNNDGYSKVSYSAPSVTGISNAVTRALENIDLSPDDIGYVEAHGTGTRIGDPIEIEALTKAYRKKTLKRGFCAIGSVKANVGHVDAAAGVTGLIKTALCLKHKTIPPQACFEYPNENISLVNSPFYINTEARYWDAGDKPRIAAVNSIGMGGTNAHIILSDYCSEKIENAVVFQDFMLPLSAKTKNAMEKKIDDVIEFIQSTSEELRDIAYTLQVGRMEMKYRCSVICNSKEEAVSKLFAAKEKINIVGNNPVIFQFTQYQPDINEWKKTLQILPCAEQITNKYIKCLSLYLNIDKVIEKYSSLNTKDRKMIDFIFGVVIQMVYAKLLNMLGIVAATSISDTEELLFCSAALSQNVSENDFITFLICKSQENYVNKQADCSLFKPIASERKGANIYNDLNDFCKLPESKDSLIVHLNSCTVKAILCDLQKLWLNGQRINWFIYYEGIHCGRVSLPSYPFERKKYWVAARTEETKKGEYEVKETNDEKPEPRKFIQNTWTSLLGIDAIELSDNYFEIGGTSLLATHLISVINAHFNSQYTLLDFYSAPTIQGVLDYLNEHTDNFMKANEPEHTNSDKAASYIFSQEDFQKADALAKCIGNEMEVESILPLSANQERLLFYSLFHRSAGMYYQKYIMDIVGEVQVEYLIQAYRKVIHLHDVFRSIYTYRELSRPVQIILKQREPEYCYRDLSAVDDVRQWIDDFEAHDSQTGFKLSYDSAIRLHIFKVKKSQYKIVLSLHHICFDGYSCNVVLNEIYDWYCALLAGEALRIPEPLPRRSYIDWYLQQNRIEAINYWKEYLGDFEQHGNFVNRIIDRGANNSLHIVTKMFTIDEKLVENMTAFCKRKAVTVNTLILLAYVLMIAKVEKARDIVCGTVINGRPEELKGADRLVGIYADVIPLRVQLKQPETIDNLLRSIQKDIAIAKKYSYLSLMDIIANTNVVEADFQHVINLESLVNQKKSLKHFEITNMELVQKSKYMFSFILQNTLKGYCFRIEYDEKISDETVDRFNREMQELLAMVMQENLNFTDIMNNAVFDK